MNFWMAFLVAIGTSQSFSSLPCDIAEIAPLIGKADVEKTISKWKSNDVSSLAIKLVQSPICKGPEISKILQSLKLSYLIPLDAVPKDSVNLDLFFRAFLVPSEEYQKLGVKLREKKPREPKDISRAFGKYRMIRGVLVLGASQSGAIEKLLGNLCPQTECSFWNPRLIFRVVVTKTPGVAAYIPELATLMLSHELLGIDNNLFRFVLAHELSHVWIRGQELDGKNVLKDFGEFSGWGKADHLIPPKVTTVGAWTDSLVHLSAQSSFSIVPDGVLKNADPSLDGFITEGAMKNSLERNDLSEDVADHIAGFFTMPSRFCWKGSLLTPRKLAWLETQFGKRVMGPCKN